MHWNPLMAGYLLEDQSVTSNSNSTLTFRCELLKMAFTFGSLTGWPTCLYCAYTLMVCPAGQMQLS